MRSFVRLGTYLLVLVSNSNCCDAASTGGKTPTATCPARTVNYVTHSLAQQCLASSRTASSSSTTSNTSTISLSPPTSNVTVPLSGDSAYSDSSVSAPSSDPASTPDAVVSTDAASPSDSSSSKPVTISTANGPTADVALSSPSALGDAFSEEILLDGAKFLSFEDWKQQNLRKTGQSESIGQERNTDREPRKRPMSVDTTLDSLGDDPEIDLDFAGFVPPGLEVKLEPTRPRKEPSEEAFAAEHLPKVRPRSKEAGTTSKERFNYASFDCAANVLKTNPQAKGASSVLGENKDSYMLNECSAEIKYLVLELCNDIQIDTIVLANFEFFSSTFRAFRVSVSDKYPLRLDKWKTIGTFEARNTRELQAFRVENPIIWARYVRFEFLTHYGNEFYCPVSLVRIHGTTMLEEYKHDLDLAQDDDEDDDGETTSVAADVEEGIVAPDTIGTALLQQDETAASPYMADVTIDALPQKSLVSVTSNQFNRSSVTQDQAGKCMQRSRYANATMIFSPREGLLATCALDEGASPAFDSNDSNAGQSKLPVPSLATQSALGYELVQTNKTSLDNRLASPTASSPLVSSSPDAQDLEFPNPSQPLENSSTTVSASTPGLANATNTSKPKTSTSGTQSSAPVPTIQESFFKSVQKRLQMLETNSSLSLQYIEEQSRALRDAFSNVEQRQLAKTGKFLDYLNTTVLNELRDFRQQYDQLWQSTVIELEMQREQFQHQTVAMNARLGVLADEVIFQKRMAMLQMVLLLLCLGLVLFSRGSHNYLELPLVQNMLNRSHSTRWMSISGLDTPSHSPPLSRPSSSHQHKPSHSILKRHNRQLFDDSTNGVSLIGEPYSPPTPNSVDETLNREHNNTTDHKHGLSQSNDIPSADPAFDPADIERPGTSPPVLPSSSGNSPVVGPDTTPPPNVSTIDSQVMESPSPRRMVRTTAHFTLQGASPRDGHAPAELNGC